MRDEEVKGNRRNPERDRVCLKIGGGPVTKGVGWKNEPLEILLIRGILLCLTFGRGMPEYRKEKTNLGEKFTCCKDLGY